MLTDLLTHDWYDYTKKVNYTRQENKPLLIKKFTCPCTWAINHSFLAAKTPYERDYMIYVKDEKNRFCSSVALGEVNCSHLITEKAKHKFRIKHHVYLNSAHGGRLRILHFIPMSLLESI